ncbi:MAG: YihY/virulence factor BrkB family protein [Microthrixaceae bacterium]
MSGLDGYKERFDAVQRERPILAIPFAVVKKYGDDKGSHLSALLAYYGFFSLFPMLLAGFTILGFVLHGNPSLRHDIGDTLRERLPLPGIDVSTMKGSGLALVVGLVLAVWSGLGATQVAQDALNTVWDVPRKDRPTFVRKRLKGLAMLAIIGTGIVGATVAASAAAFLGPAAGLGGAVLSVLVNAAVIATLFRLMVERPLGWGEVRIGALFGGIGWTVLQLVGGWYTGRLVDNADKTYGTFAVVIGLLSWIFLQSQVLVYAAEVASVTSRRLWPRSLDPGRPTDADGRVAEAMVARVLPPDAVGG